MNKIAVLLLLFSLIFSFSHFPVSAEDSFEIIDGQTFTYEVITSDVSAKIGTKKFSSSTFQIGGHKCSLNDSVEVSVTSVCDKEVNYTTTCEDVSIDQTLFDDSLFHYVHFNYYMGYAYNIAARIYHGYSEFGNFSSMTLSDGLEIREMLYFIGANESNWFFLEELFTDLNSSTAVFDTSGSISASTVYKESNGIVHFESWLLGDLSIDEISGKISNGFSCDYNKSNGVLLGLRTKGSFKGRAEGRSVTCSTDFHIELANYDLADLSLYSALSPVDNVVVISFGFLTICIVFRKVRVRKK